ncbi:hypothetical protein AA0114_g575 [Alternaria tenuissima]|uniref:F-box domain-containing protein n=1 Tax=Alternaria tenuissima TaxID=119927 RepID=A0A4Q4MW07_9PLEO|nr:hypothetical protein AA0114_g575 [Alternaria tenuissima]
MLGPAENGLLRLVDELLLNIIDHIDNQDALCSLSATCTRFQGLVEPYIWRKLEVLTGDHARNIATALDKRDDRTDYIQDLAIRYNDIYRDGVEELNHFLSLMSKLRHLHIESPCPNNVEWQHGGIYFDGYSRIDYTNLLAASVYPRSGMPMTLPMLQSLTLHAHGSGDNKYKLGRAVAMFKHPSLQNITLSCLDFDGELGISASQTKTTPLRSLTLIECNVNVKFLDEVLSLPKALKELSIGERLHVFQGCQPSMDPERRTSSRQFLLALQKQAHSLQRLTHCGGHVGHLTPRDTDPEGAEKLRSLVDLEYLELGFESHLYYYLRQSGFPPALRSLKMLDSAISINSGHDLRSLSDIAFRSLTSLVDVCLPRTLVDDFTLHLKFSDHSFFRLFEIVDATEQAHLLSALFFDRAATYKIASMLKSYSTNSHFLVSRETFPSGKSFIPPYMHGEELPVEELMYTSDDFWRFNGINYRIMDDENWRDELKKGKKLAICKRYTVLSYERMQTDMEVSVIMADRPITTTASRLMALPGELRNRIYKAITDDEGPEKIRLYRTNPCGQFLKVRNPGRQYRGLGQTNRMFRSEFMPLYLTVRRPLIAMEDVPYYLEAFPLPDPVLTASIITVLRDLLSAFEEQTLTSKIDFLPLLRMDWTMMTFIIALEMMNNISNYG